MFDSNVFDQLPEIIEKIKESAEKQYEYFISTIQIEELCEIPDEKKDKRITNILMMADLRAKLVPVSLALLGRARWGYARFGKGEVYLKILNQNKSNTNDAIIADTAVYEGCTLITEDKDLYKRMEENGYDVTFLTDFLNTIQSNEG